MYKFLKIVVQFIRYLVFIKVQNLDNFYFLAVHNAAFK